MRRPAITSRRLGRWLAGLGGVALVVGGIFVAGRPAFEAWQRAQASDAAVRAWQPPAQIAGPSTSTDTADAAPAAPACTGATPEAGQQLVTFPSLDRYGYRGVAADGTWDLLTKRTMVHHKDTPAPGGAGNVVIAFHREPSYLHMDELAVGDVIDVEDSSCHSFVYRIAERWQLPADKVTQLGPTRGHDLTLITCTPWYLDYDRLVWRAALVINEQVA